MVKILKFKRQKSLHKVKIVILTIAAAIIVGTIVGVYAPVEDKPIVQSSNDFQNSRFDKNCLIRCPVGKVDNKIVMREIYTLSNNSETKFADWVAYHVTLESIGPSKSRNWKSDPDLLDNDTLEPNDYLRAHELLKTDRGHQVPLASFSGTNYWYMTNYLSNITPQKSNLNQGAWAKLENAVRAAVTSGKDLYVLTGPLYEKSTEKLPQADEPHIVPSGYWKVVASDDGSLTAFIFDQNLSRQANYCDQIVSYEEIELRAKVEFPSEFLDFNFSNLSSLLNC